MCDLCEVYSICRNRFKSKGDIVIIHRYEISDNDDENGRVGQIGYKIMLPRYDIPTDNPLTIKVSTLCIKVADSIEDAKSLVDTWAQYTASKMNAEDKKLIN